ncbi:MAG: hypothetical protein JST26_17120 [Bacteroidetes bacterium]|nr:hypothetical protein [Bacteroidota bacterium]
MTLSEHYLKDLIVPKFFVRSKIEFLTGKISFAELMTRTGDIFRNKWQNIDELIAFNTKQGVPSSFFIGVKNGVGLNYPVSAAAFWIKRMLEKNCEVSIHGIEFETYEKIKSEYDIFRNMSAQAAFGIRMHYVRTNEETYTNMAKAGYIYDSTEMGFRAPYKIGNMWEFPFQIMDSYIIEKPRQWQSKNLQQAKDETRLLIDKAFECKLPYLGIDFHDRYFSPSFKTWMEWYMWLTTYLKENQIECVNFKTAVKELESPQA